MYYNVFQKFRLTKKIPNIQLNNKTLKKENQNILTIKCHVILFDILLIYKSKQNRFSFLSNYLFLQVLSCLSRQNILFSIIVFIISVYQ